MKQRKRKYKNIKLKNKNDIVSNKKKKLLQKKDNILYKYGIDHVLFFQKHSNVFLFLKKEKKKHVVTLTGGSCKFGNTKKQKISPFNINIIIKRLKDYCILYNVYRIRFFLRSSINKHYYNIIKYLSLYNIKIMELGYVLHLPHNGIRGKKLRRI